MLSKILLISVMVVALSACATVEPTPIVNTVIQRVEVPIPVPCNVIIPPAPAFAFGTLMEANTIFQKVQILLSDRQLHIGYETLLLAALQSCK